MEIIIFNLFGICASVTLLVSIIKIIINKLNFNLTNMPVLLYNLAGHDPYDAEADKQ